MLLEMPFVDRREVDKYNLADDKSNMDAGPARGLCVPSLGNGECRPVRTELLLFANSLTNTCASGFFATAAPH